ncbi:hypothetical protein [Erwinia piriflorinigrans]|uniref:Uncharacterized protein n=1 Tax=Erwinia piriflorinigrans CFBP 5888 TaxID=1161919 RepID=V5Z6T7_9GAMM|nr:hypothetical protein [Erwinia piriflorinigrans]CCG87026.1 hypothetical protein EPIR_1661 [Erwinia piriflorinigrans CFBP 5888]
MSKPETRIKKLRGYFRPDNKISASEIEENLGDFRLFLRTTFENI